MEHTEGKKWYLEMRSFSRELLNQDLPEKEKELTGYSNRREWWDHMIETFIMPAATGIPKESATQSGPELSEEEDLAKRKATHFGQVVPIEDVEKIIDRASSVTRMPCGCRFKTTGKADKRYCFGLGMDDLGIMGNYPDTASSFEVLEKEEAKKVMRKLDEEGLIHSVWTGITPYVCALCNCDHDCGWYRNIERGIKTSVFRSEYVCQVSDEACMGCRQCMSQCQFGAMSFSHAESKVHIEVTSCYGCGLCRAPCPTDAIKLLPRTQVPEAAAIWRPAKKDHFAK